MQHRSPLLSCCILKYQDRQKQESLKTDCLLNQANTCIRESTALKKQHALCIKKKFLRLPLCCCRMSYCCRSVQDCCRSHICARMSKLHQQIRRSISSHNSDAYQSTYSRQ